MVSVIEHQKVERRTRVKRKLDSTQRKRRIPASSAARRARAGRPHVISPRGRGWRLKWTTPSWIQRVSPIPFLRRRTRTGSLLRRASAVRRSVSLAIEERDIPLLAAAVGFAVMANMLLLSVNVDRILLSGAVSSITLPPQSELVTRSSLSPQHDEFAVIGEVASVDPSRFARLEVSEYRVQPGDTLGEIAGEYGLEMDTLISFNQIEDVRRLQVGETFQIPNRDGLLYTAKRGDSISSIASDHGTSINAILDANDLRTQDIAEGQVLFVPGARLNETELQIILGELLAWPTAGVYTSGFGMRADPFTGLPRFHNGIDLANSVGTPVRAAASGRVVHVESQIGNYGRFVIVRHPDGFQTLYAHMSAFSVRSGEYVERGERLGTMGNTGRSTGPHLHFSVIHNGTFVDPLRYLR